MNNNKEETASATDHIESLGRRLGRLELRGVELVEQLVVLTDRLEVTQAAVLEEHIDRNKDWNIIEKLADEWDELENNLKACEEEHAKQNDKFKAKLSKSKDDHTDLKEMFLSLVIHCQGFEEKIKRLERSNDELMEAMKDLEKDKEKLMESLYTNTNHTHPCMFLVPPPMTVSPSSSTSSTITAPLFSQSPIRSMASQPPVVHPVISHAQFMPVHPPSPHQYTQNHDNHDKAAPLIKWLKEAEEESESSEDEIEVDFDTRAHVSRIKETSAEPAKKDSTPELQEKSEAKSEEDDEDDVDIDNI